MSSSVSCTAQCVFNTTVIVQKKAIKKKNFKTQASAVKQVHIRRLHQQHEVGWCCRRCVSGPIPTLCPPPAVGERRKHFELILNSHWFAPSCPFLSLRPVK